MDIRRAFALRHLRLSQITSHLSAGCVPSSARLGQRDGPIPTKTYIICTNPRSGSWLICDGLASTSVAGNPSELFHDQEIEEHRAQWRMDNPTDLTLEDYLRVALPESITSNGVCGIKLQYLQFEELPHKVQALGGPRGMSPAELLSAMFPDAKYIWLRRRDKVRQAISLYIAWETNEWWSVSGSSWSQTVHRSGKSPYPRRIEANKNPQFDPIAIAGWETELREEDRKWQAFFETNAITPLVIDYEDVVSDYSGTITKVLEWLGIPSAESISIPLPRLRRQSNARSDEWVDLYTAFKRDHPDSLAGAVAPPPSALYDSAEKPFEAIPNLWKQWVAQAQRVAASGAMRIRGRSGR
jgi:trehalose 2-sulfotransferase